MKIAAITISDRASDGTYEDKSGPAILAYLEKAVTSPWEPVHKIIPDGIESVSSTLKKTSG